MKYLLQYRDGVYYLHTVKNDKEVSVFLDIYKFDSNEKYSKSKTFKVTTELQSNFTGFCAGIVRDNRDEHEGIKSFLIAIETKITVNEPDHCLTFYKLKFNSIFDEIPNSIAKIDHCQLQTTSFKNNLSNHQFLPGPYVIWITNYVNISIFSFLKSKLMMAPITNELGVKFVLLQAQFVRDDIIHKQILLACQKLHLDNFQNYITSLSFFLLCYDNDKLIIKNVQTVPSELFISSDYENVSCISIILHAEIGLETTLQCKPDQCTSNFGALKRNSCCIISKQATNVQFLVFVQGFAKYCCQIPAFNYTHILKITKYNPYSCSFVLKSNKGICAVQRNDNGRISVKEVWHKANDVTYGDFLHNGQSQLVLFTKGNKNSAPNFDILDARNFSKLNETKSNPELVQVHQALQRRLLLGQEALSKVEESLRNRQGVLESAVKSLKIAQCTGELPACVEIPENLVNWDKKDNLMDIIMPKNVPDLGLKLLSRWNCVYGNNWTIGITFINQSDYNIKDFTGILTTDDQQLESFFKIFIHQTSEIPSQPILTKKGKSGDCVKPNQMISAVFSLKVPKMMMPTLNANLIIKWTLERDLTQQMPMITGITMEDIVSSTKFFELPIVQRLMSLRTTEKLMELTLISTNYSSHHLERILTENKDNGDFPDVYNFSDQQTFYVFSEQISILFGVNFEIEINSGDEANLLVYYSDENQLLVFTQWIYAKLPKGFILVPNENKLGDACQELWQAMKDELEYIEHSLDRDNTSTTNLDFGEPCKKVLKRTNEMLSKWRDEGDKAGGMTYEDYIKFRKTLLGLEMITDKILRKILLR